LKDLYDRYINATPLSRKSFTEAISKIVIHQQIHRDYFLKCFAVGYEYTRLINADPTENPQVPLFALKSQSTKIAEHFSNLFPEITLKYGSELINETILNLLVLGAECAIFTES